MKKHILPLTFLLLALLFFAASAFASEVKIWKDSSVEDRKGGSFQGVSLLGSGAIVLSPEVTPWSEHHRPMNASAFYWSQVLDSSGNLYIGSGNEGRLFQITKNGQESILFEAEEYEITALAIDNKDNIYAGTSPRGKIYKVLRDRTSEVLCDLEERYIWDLAFDPSGNLFAATGETGLIFKISEEGDYEIFYNSTETHIVSLAFDPSGNLLAGSDGNGLLYKISPAGEAEILLASGMREISAISTAKEGDVYIAALYDPERDRESPLIELKLQELVSATEREKRASESTMEQSPEKTFQALLEGFPSLKEERQRKKPQSVLFRISAEEGAEKIFSFPEEKVFALHAASEGTLYIGTGEPARLYRMETKGKAAFLQQFKGSQVTAIHPVKYSGLSVLTSNPGRSYKVSHELESSGTFLSRSYDTKMKSDWGTISCHFEARSGTGLELFTRSGNNPHPNSEWSSWSRPYDPSLREAISSPPARFIQWKAKLTSVGSTKDTPILKSVSISYLQRNKPPEIASLSLIGAGQPLPLPPSKNAPTGNSNAPKKIVIEKGKMGILWQAADPNDDALLFTLHYRSEQGKEWEKIDQIKSEQTLIWDHSAIPEGSYTLRLVVDDSPANYLGEEKSDEILSEPFVIDHTPPQVSFEKSPSGDRLVLKIKAEDGTGRISRLLYSPDQKQWSPIKPMDRICDSPVEHFEFSREIKTSQPLFLKCLDDSLNETLLEVK